MERPMKELIVEEGKYAGQTNTAIQQAVDDAAAAGGGTVTIRPGLYLMHDALHLRSGVRVVGRKDVVLQKVPSAESRILDFLGYGHYEVSVAEPDRFPVGTGVHVLDNNAGGFYTTVGTVVAREGELLFINRMLNHDYHGRDNARVVSVFPIVEAEGVHDAAIEGFVIDGDCQHETFTLNGCRGGGVFLITSSRVVVRDVEVRNYRGDAVSFQQCTDILVDRCHVHHNTGTGLHPGSGTVRYVMRDNDVHDNGAWGVFYCLRTTHSICRGNTIRANARPGISVGERDTDHLIEANKITGNGQEGISFRRPERRSGDRVIVRGNDIGPNCVKDGRFEVSILSGLSEIHVLDNRFTVEKTQALGVEKGCRNVSFAGNKVGGRDARAEDVSDEAGLLAWTVPAKLPAVGPSALPLNGARHLNIAKLPPWEMT
jgi:hypothetical protein